MKPESPLVVIQASRMKENENSGLESDSEVDKLFRIRPTICNMYPLRIWFRTSGKGSILNLTAVLGNLNQTSGRVYYCKTAGNEQFPEQKEN